MSSHDSERHFQRFTTLILNRETASDENADVFTDSDILRLCSVTVCEIREGQRGSDPSKSMRDPCKVVICRDPGWVPEGTQGESQKKPSLLSA